MFFVDMTVFGSEQTTSKIQIFGQEGGGLQQKFFFYHQPVFCKM